MKIFIDARTAQVGGVNTNAANPFSELPTFDDPDDRIGVTYLGVDYAAFDKSSVDGQTEARVRAKYSLPESFIFCLVRMMKTEIDKGYAQAARYTYEDGARQTLRHYERIANS